MKKTVATKGYFRCLPRKSNRIFFVCEPFFIMHAISGNIERMRLGVKNVELTQIYWELQGVVRNWKNISLRL